MAIQRLVFKSDEDAGASQPNIVTLRDPDAALLDEAAGIPFYVAGDLTSVTTELRSNYNKATYPAGSTEVFSLFCIGTGASYRVSFKDVTSETILVAALKAGMVGGSWFVPGTAIAVNRLIAGAGPV